MSRSRRWDVSIQAQIINLLERIQRERGISYLFIAHDLGAVKHISNRIGAMYLGSLVEIGSSDDLYHHPLHPYTQALLASIPIPDPKRMRERQEGGDQRRDPFTAGYSVRLSVPDPDAPMPPNGARRKNPS